MLSDFHLRACTCCTRDQLLYYSLYADAMHVCRMLPHRSQTPTHTTGFWWIFAVKTIILYMKMMCLFNPVSYNPSPRDTWREVCLSIHDSPILRDLLLSPRGDSYSDEPSLEFNHFLNTSPPSSPSNFPSQKTIRYHLTEYCDWHPTGIYKSQTKLLFSQVRLEGVFLNLLFFGFFALCI